MAFGIPGTENNGGEFLGRIQYDARVGFWQIVRRVQTNDGWQDEKSDPFRGVSLLVDFGSLEVGYVKLTSPPAFLLVPYGQAIPPQPQEMTQDGNGNARKAFAPGVRVKVASPKTFGDSDAYHLTANSKTLLGALEDLHKAFLAAPEAAAGKLPGVQVSKTVPITNKTPQGTTTFHAPVFEIVGWAERPACFGDRTVPAPGFAASRPIQAAPPPPPPAAVPTEMPAF